ncbi:MAG TPA: tetratricopeptide repeat protein, partial [Nostocaceae cyanobacterium]|nr:tetratricopeptide repeat protein [Nostocaceae cyanobacterium]
MAYWQGRQEEIKQLRQWLNNPNIPLIGIEGIGGTGKSMLAAKIYEEIKESFPKRFWADVSYGAIFSDIAREVLTEFGFYVPEEEAKLVQALVRCLRSGQFLLIIDNLESLLTEDRTWGSQFYSDFFQSWVEFGGSSTVIVTTRERPEFPRFEWLSLQGLKIEEGTALLTELGIKGDLEEFVKIVDGHPLLLRLVADLLKEEFKQDPNLSRLADLGLGNLRQLLTDPQVVGTHRRENVGMVLVLDASFQRLSELQKSLFLSISIFRGAIDKGMAAAVLPGSNEKEIEKELRNLVKRSLLIEKLEQKRRFEFQPVVLEYAKYKALNYVPNRDIYHKEVHQRAIYYYLLNLKPKPWKTKEDIKEYLEVFYHWYELENYDAAFDILINCNDFLTMQGYYNILLDVYTKLVKAWDKTVEKNTWKFWFSLSELGNTYHSLGDYKQAINKHKRCLKIANNINNPNCQSYSLGNLGDSYHKLGQYKRAIEYHQQSLEISRVIDDNHGESIALNNLGNAYIALENGSIPFWKIYFFRLTIESGSYSLMKYASSELGCSLENYLLAVEYLQMSLRIKKEIGDYNGESNCLNNLAVIYRILGKFNEASECLQKSLQIQNMIVNHIVVDRRGKANVWFNLGGVLVNANRVEDAVGAYYNARELYQDMGLEKETQLCNKAINRLSQPKPSIPSRRGFWGWLRRLWY